MIYAFYLKGTVQVVTVIVSTRHEMHMEMSDKKCRDKKSLKCRDCLVQRHLFSFAQYRAGSPGEQLQGAGKPRETQHNIEGEDL
jgi:hypothetical protein